MRNNNETSVKVTNSLEQDARYLTMIFITLKLCGVLSWSWWWVLSPLPILIVSALVVGIGNGLARRGK